MEISRWTYSEFAQRVLIKFSKFPATFRALKGWLQFETFGPIQRMTTRAIEPEDSIEIAEQMIDFDW